MYIELFKDSDKLWRWRLKGGNSEVLATSESYNSKRNCRDTVCTVLNCMMASLPIKTAAAKKPAKKAKRKG